MHSDLELSLFTLFSALSFTTLMAVAPVESQPQLQIQVEQFNPDMSGETKFIQESEDRFYKLEQENQGMIKADNQMMQEGYDPNEKYFQPKKL